jgi:hypothetical protein
VVAQIDKSMIKKRPSKVFGRLASWALIEGRPLTTKGQWINPFVFLGYKLAQASPLHSGADSPIYIVGTGRSGTTFLGTLFAMHRETVFLNEPKALWHAAHGGEDIIGSYTTAPGKMRLSTSDATPEMTQYIAKIYSTAIRVGFAKRVVDKYPELVFRVPFVLKLFPKAKFIAILRDGVDTCSSVTAWSKRKGETIGDETHDWWGRDGRKWNMIVEELVPEHEDLAPLQGKLKTTQDQRDRAAVEWIISMREAKAAAEAHPEVLAITFEELCARPEEVLKRLTDHCEIGPDKIFIDYATAILDAPDAYKPLAIMPELVAPFCDTLRLMGYDASIERVKARDALA